MKHQQLVSHRWRYSISGLALVVGIALLQWSLRVGAEEQKTETYAHGSGGQKSVVKLEQKGKETTLRILKWETGTLITKDEKTGADVRQTFKYPVLDQSGFHTMGDNTLCWQVCKDACDGYGVCHAVCWWKCAGQGGEGDPRKP